MATQPPSQPQTGTPQNPPKVQVSKGSSTKLRSPIDFFTLGYWLLFILGVPLITYIMAHKPVSTSPQLQIPLFKNAVPAYHVITANDLDMKPVDQPKVTGDIVRNTQDLVGHYTLVPVQSGKPVSQNQVGPMPQANLIAKTLAVAIPATGAMILSGNLRAGDIVKVAVVPLTGSISETPPTIIFEKILVLDVKAAVGQNVIVLAIPSDRWLEYLSKTRNATLVLARAVE